MDNIKKFNKLTSKYDIDNSASHDLYYVLKNIVDSEEITPELASKIFNNFKEQYG